MRLLNHKSYSNQQLYHSDIFIPHNWTMDRYLNPTILYKDFSQCLVLKSYNPLQGLFTMLEYS
jgi:hypothetical protein